MSHRSKIMLSDEEMGRKIKRSKNQWALFKKYYVSETFLDQYVNDIDDDGWFSISFYQNLSLPCILKHKENFKSKLSFTQALLHKVYLDNFELIHSLKDDLDWRTISSQPYLSKEFICVFADYLNWHLVCSNILLEESILEKYSHLLDWAVVSNSQKLSTAFMERHKDKLHWEQVSKKQKMGLKFIEKHKDKLNWQYMIPRSSLRMNSKFLEKHIDKLDEQSAWYYIGRQKLDAWFIEKYQDKINNWQLIIMKNDISEELLDKFSYKFNSNDWFYVSIRQKISVNFIIKHIQDIWVDSLRRNKNLNQEELKQTGVFVVAALCGKDG